MDGEFVSLPNNVGNSIYRLEVYAFNQASYRSNQAAIDAAIKSTNNTESADDQATSNPFKNALPTWTTECTATQSDEVETLAQCNPLTPGLGGVGDGTTKPTPNLARDGVLPAPRWPPRGLHARRDRRGRRRLRSRRRRLGVGRRS